MMSNFKRTRQEAIIAAALWACFAVWVVSVSYYLGYVSDVQTTVLGLPRWIVWGVLVPWVTAVVVNSLFAWLVLAGDE